MKPRVWTHAEILATEPEAVKTMARAIAGELELHLRGQNPQSVGLALAEMVAKWLAGHQQGSEARLMQFFDQIVADSVPAIRAAIWESYAAELEASRPQ